MTLELLISREAKADLAEAIGAYHNISPVLSARFAAELEVVYSAIVEYPQIYPLVYKSFRRALLRKFPYSVFYTIEKSFILIIGVIHQARDESTWKRRA